MCAAAAGPRRGSGRGAATGSRHRQCRIGLRGRDSDGAWRRPRRLRAPSAVPQAPWIDPQPVADEGAYTVDAGDRLRDRRVRPGGPDQFLRRRRERPHRHAAHRLGAGRGATTDQLSRRIADKLRQGYIREPHVAVEIEAYRPFFILGEVTQPGQYPYVANMTVETAVAIAGGFAPRAFRQTVIVTRFVNGEQLRMTVPVNCPVRPGDTVNVQERWF